MPQHTGQLLLFGMAFQGEVGNEEGAGRKVWQLVPDATGHQRDRYDVEDCCRGVDVAPGGEVVAVFSFTEVGNGDG